MATLAAGASTTLTLQVGQIVTFEAGGSGTVTDGMGNTQSVGAVQRTFGPWPFVEVLYVSAVQQLTYTTFTQPFTDDASGYIPVRQDANTGVLLGANGAPVSGAGISPPTRDTMGINIAIAAVAAIGAGFVQLADAAYTVLPGVPVVAASGVSIIGVQPELQHTSDIMDKDWTIVAGTRFVGDGSTNGIQYNNAARGTPNSVAGNGTPFAADILAGCTFKNLAFINCKRGIDIGATNAAGAGRCNFDEIYFDNCAEWNWNLENFAHCEFGTVYSRSSASRSSFGDIRHVASVATSLWEPGNSRYSKRIFVTLNNIRRRGFVIEANNSGTLNELTIESAQVNRFAGAEETYAWTMANGSTDITVSNAALFPLGFPVVPTATAGGFTSGLMYFVVFSSGTTVRLGARPKGTAIAANAAGTLNIKTSGFCLMEAVSDDTGTGSAITNCKFKGLDLEGTASGAFLESFGINNEVNLQQAFTSQYSHLIFRNCQKNVVMSAYPAVTDFDATGNETVYYGVRSTILPGSWAGQGMWRDPSATSDKGVISLNPTAVGPAWDLKKAQIAGVGHFLQAALALCEPQGRAGSGARSLLVADAGTQIFNGSAASVWTLPTLQAGTLPIKYRIVNAGSAALTVNTGNGELFNQVASKTGYSLAAGQWLNLEAAQTSTGTLFWAVTATNGT